MRKKVFKSKLNFSKAELAGEVHLGAVGVNLPMTERHLDKSQYSMCPDWLQLGSLFGSMNDPKFYSNVTMQDVIPKDEDFIEVPFRLLSATTVGAGSWKAADFSNAQILKESMTKLNGKPLYKDHETDLDNWVGIVKGTKWSESFTQDGNTIPAGIDGIVAIDAKTNPKIARGVLMGSIFSNSVTVVFHWVMSHNFSDENEFYSNIGQMVDGSMVRRIVTHIEDYHESSLVWLGADPFAKAIAEDGSLKHPDLGSVYSYTKASYDKVAKVTLDDTETPPEDVAGVKKVNINFALDKNVLSLADKNKNNTPNTDNKMEEFIAAFIASFGEQFQLKAGDKPTEDQMIANLAKLTVTPEQPKVDGLLQFLKDETGEEVSLEKASDVVVGKKLISADRFTALEAAETEAASLKTEVANLKPQATIGEQYINTKKNEAIALYKKTVGAENVDENVVSLFKDADSAAIDGLLKQYTKSATGKFSGSCSDCGSHNFKFQSSFTADNDPEEEDEDEVVGVEALREKWGNASMSIGRTAE